MELLYIVLRTFLQPGNFFKGVLNWIHCFSWQRELCSIHFKKFLKELNGSVTRIFLVFLTSTSSNTNKLEQIFWEFNPENRCDPSTFNSNEIQMSNLDELLEGLKLNQILKNISCKFFAWFPQNSDPSIMSFPPRSGWKLKNSTFPINFKWNKADRNRNIKFFTTKYSCSCKNQFVFYNFCTNSTIKEEKYI